MMMLEQVRRPVSWMDALTLALTRPPGVPERRGGEDPWAPKPVDRPRRATDDLAWLRQAVDDPEAAGLRAIDAQLPVWEVADANRVERLERLSGRGILAAAGFELHRADQSG